MLLHGYPRWFFTTTSYTCVRPVHSIGSSCPNRQWRQPQAKSEQSQKLLQDAGLKFETRPAQNFLGFSRFCRVRGLTPLAIRRSSAEEVDGDVVIVCHGIDGGPNAGRASGDPRRGDESGITVTITLTLTIPNIYHTAVMRAIGACRCLCLCAGGGSCQPSNRRKNLGRRTPPARGPPMLPMVRCSHSTGQRHGAGLSR